MAFDYNPTLMMFPGGTPIGFADMLQNAGVPDAQYIEQANAQIAALQAQIDDTRAALQRSIDQLREDVLGSTPTEPQAAGAPPRTRSPGLPRSR